MNDTLKKPRPVRNIRFKDDAQIELIKRAAEHYGLSVNAFIVRISVRAAERALEMPADPLINNTLAATIAAGPFLDAASSRTKAQLKETAA